MSLQQGIWWYLWVAPHLLLVAVAVVMVRKGQHKEFPIFFSYLLFEILQFLLLFTVRYVDAGLTGFYVKVDTFCRAGSIAFRFGILQELFESPVTHSIQLRRATARILNWTTGLLVLLGAGFIGALYYNVVGRNILLEYAMSQALDLSQCGLLAMVFLWHRFLGLRMSPVAFGIAIGLGLVSAVQPLAIALKSAFPADYSKIIDLGQMGTYHVAVLLWLYFAQLQEKTGQKGEASPVLFVRDWAVDLARITNL